MKFRPLRIDYEAEAIQILRERRPQQQQEQQTRNDGIGSPSLNKEGINYCRRYRRVIHVILPPSSPPSTAPPGEEKENEKTGKDRAAEGEILAWPSFVYDNSLTHRKHCSVRDSDNANQSNKDMTTHGMMDVDDDEECFALMKVERSSVTASAKVSIDYNKAVEMNDDNGDVIIDYNLFFNSSWLLKLASSIRRQTNRSRIANEPFYRYQHKYYHHYHNSPSLSLSPLLILAKSGWWNDSFLNLYHKTYQRIFEHYLFLRCSKVALKRLDELMIIQLYSHKYHDHGCNKDICCCCIEEKDGCDYYNDGDNIFVLRGKAKVVLVPRHHTVQRRQQQRQQQRASSSSSSSAFQHNYIFKGGTMAMLGVAQLGPKQKRREALKRELSAIVVFSSASSRKKKGDQFNSIEEGNNNDSKDKGEGEGEDDEGAINAPSSSSALLMQKILATAIMATTAAYSYQKQQQHLDGTLRNNTLSLLPPVLASIKTASVNTSSIAEDFRHVAKRQKIRSNDDDDERKVFEKRFISSCYSGNMAPATPPPLCLPPSSCIISNGNKKIGPHRIRIDGGELPVRTSAMTDTSVSSSLPASLTENRNPPLEKVRINRVIDQDQYKNQKYSAHTNYGNSIVHHRAMKETKLSFSSNNGTVNERQQRVIEGQEKEIILPLKSNLNDRDRGGNENFRQYDNKIQMDNDDATRRQLGEEKHCLNIRHDCRSQSIADKEEEMKMSMQSSPSSLVRLESVRKRLKLSLENSNEDISCSSSHHSEKVSLPSLTVQLNSKEMKKQEKKEKKGLALLHRFGFASSAVGSNGSNDDEDNNNDEHKNRNRKCIITTRPQLKSVITDSRKNFDPIDDTEKVSQDIGTHYTPTPNHSKQTTVGRVSTDDKKADRFYHHHNHNHHHNQHNNSQSPRSQENNNNIASPVEIGSSSQEQFPFHSNDSYEEYDDNSDGKEVLGSSKRSSREKDDLNATDVQTSLKHYSITASTTKQKRNRMSGSGKDGERRHQRKEGKEKRKKKKRRHRKRKIADVNNDHNLETPRKLNIKDVSPIKKKGKVGDVRMSKLIAKANIIIQEGNFSEATVNSGIYQKVPPLSNSKNASNDNTTDDPFFLCEGTTDVTENARDVYKEDRGKSIVGSNTCAEQVTEADIINGRENCPIHLLCSEIFYENFGEVITELIQYSSEKEYHHKASKPFEFTDTHLIDNCNVDIEIYGSRCAIIVGCISVIQNSGGWRQFLLRVLDVAATTRYHKLDVFVCIDVDVDSSVAQCLGEFQTAFLCTETIMATKTRFRLSSKHALASLIAQRINSLAIPTSGVSDDFISSLSLSNVIHWLRDTRACTRLQFLISIIPTLSVTGALHWLDTSLMLAEDGGSQQQPKANNTNEVEDRSMRWMQKCFSNTEDESNVLNSLLQQHSAHSLCQVLNQNVAAQLTLVATVKLDYVLDAEAL